MGWGLGWGGGDGSRRRLGRRTEGRVEEEGEKGMTQLLLGKCGTGWGFIT